MSTKATAFSPTAVDAFVSIESIRVVGRHRQDLGDLKSLADSIADVDLLNPITITADSRLIAGQRRLEACRLLGWGSVPVRIAANLDEAAALLRAERDENTERKDMVLSEKASLGAALYAIEEQAAKARMAEAGRSAAPGRPRERCTELETPFRQAPPGDLDDARLVQRLASAHGGVNGLLGKAETLRKSTGNVRAHCVAAAAVEINNSGRGGKKLPSWWKGEEF